MRKGEKQEKEIKKWEKIGNWKKGKWGKAKGGNVENIKNGKS